MKETGENHMPQVTDKLWHNVSSTHHSLSEIRTDNFSW